MQVVRAGYVMSFLLPSQTGRMPFVAMIMLRRTRGQAYPSTTRCFPPVERESNTCEVQRVFTSRELGVAYYLLPVLRTVRSQRRPITLSLQEVLWPLIC